MHMSMNSIAVRGIAVSLGLSLFMSIDAAAGTVTFNDLTDIVDVTFSSDLNGRLTRGSNCGTSEVCTILLSGPSSALRASGWDSGFNIFEPGSQRQIISDLLEITPTVNNNTTTIFSITFTSDTEGAFLSFNPVLNGVDENGTVQFGGSIVWGDPGTPQVFDTMQFQSDIDNAIPEPSSLLLTLLALTSLVKIDLRRSARGISNDQAPGMLSGAKA